MKEMLNNLNKNEYQCVMLSSSISGQYVKIYYNRDNSCWSYAGVRIYLHQIQKLLTRETNPELYL